MKQVIFPSSNIQLQVMLADDDRDDRDFFDKALNVLPLTTRLETVEDGEQLMDYLLEHTLELPDVLFLDLNMPKKNGTECLTEIKQNQKLKHLPVIIYSTALPHVLPVDLYNKGAHYYFQKTDLKETQAILDSVLHLLLENNFARPAREKFILKLDDEIISQNSMNKNSLHDTRQQIKKRV